MSDKVKTVRVMYMGERVHHFNKIFQLFKDKRGREYNFSGIKGVWFGDIYEVNDNKMQVRPKSVDAKGWEPTEEERHEYEAQKLVVRAKRLERQKEMNIKKPHADIVRAVDLLRPFYLSLHRFDQERFMRWVANECSKRKKRR